MPASQLTWPGSEGAPLVAPYSAKRKLCCESPVDQHFLPLMQDDEPEGKRKCAWSERPGDDTCGVITAGMPDGGDVIASMETACDAGEMDDGVTQQQIWERSAQLAPPVNRVPSPWPSAHVPEQQETAPAAGGMETGGERPLSCVEDEATARTEAAAAVTAMDSDFTPDPAQYEPPRHSQRDSQFCFEYCGMGSLSPTSGRVRCYCKPSWEGMLSMRPYISDIY